MRSPAEGRLGGIQRLLYAGPFLTMFDRYSIAPLLIPIAAEFGRPLAEVTVLATVYFFLYGTMQVVYGILSDRFGRVAVMRVTLVGMAVAGLLGALAPSLPVLIGARALSGSMACAVMPAALVYIGDTFPFRIRQQALSSLLAAVAVGTTAASVGAGLLAHYLSWRFAFLLPAVGALALAYALRWLPESSGARRTGSPFQQLRFVLSRPWAVFLNLFAVVEGAAMLGFFTFFAPALQAHGENAATAGLVTAGYGVSVLAWTQLMKRFAARIPPQTLVFGGGAMLVCCYLLAAAEQTVPAVLVAGVLAGGGYALMHSTFQTWATEVVPQARGTATSLYATGAFLGAAIGTGAVSGLAGSHHFGLLFLIAAAATLPMVLVGGFARWRYTAALAGRDLPGRVAG